MLSHDEKKRKVEDLSSAATRVEEDIDEGIRQLYSSKTDKEALITGDDGDGKYEKYDKDAFQVRVLKSKLVFCVRYQTSVKILDQSTDRRKLR